MDGYQCPVCGRILPRPFCPHCLIADSGVGVAGYQCPSCTGFCLEPFCPRCAISEFTPGLGGFFSKIKKHFRKVVSAVKKVVTAVVTKPASQVSTFLKEQKKPLVAIGSVIGGAALMATGVGAPVGLAVMGAGIGASLGSGTGFGKPKEWMLRTAVGAAAGYAAGSVVAYAMAPAATGAIGSGSTAASVIGEGAALPGAGISAGATAVGTAAAASTPGWAIASGLFTVVGTLTPIGLALMQKAPQAMPMTADMVEQGVDPNAAANMAYQASSENPDMTPEEAQAAVDAMVSKYKLSGGGMNDAIVKLWNEHKVAVIVGGSIAAVGLLAVLYMALVPASPRKAMAVG